MGQRLAWLDVRVPPPLPLAPALHWAGRSGRAPPPPSHLHDVGLEGRILHLRSLDGEGPPGGMVPAHGQGGGGSLGLQVGLRLT